MLRLGALLLAFSLVAYLLYQLVLRPLAGFPSDDLAVILGGINTLRVGHWLKFFYALGTTLLSAGLLQLFQTFPASIRYLITLSGSGATALFLASGMLGLNLLTEANHFYPEQLADARSTILIRMVTISLFEAAIFLVGALALVAGFSAVKNKFWPPRFAYCGVVVGALLMLEFFTPEPWIILAPLLTIVWLCWLALAKGNKLGSSLLQNLQPE
jgi:hypothetical protein